MSLPTFYPLILQVIQSLPVPFTLLGWISISFLLKVCIQPYAAILLNQAIYTDYTLAVGYLIVEYAAEILSMYVQETMSAANNAYQSEISKKWINTTLPAIVYAEPDSVIAESKDGLSMKINVAYQAVRRAGERLSNKVSSLFGLIGQSIVLFNLSPTAFIVIISCNLLYSFMIYNPRTKVLSAQRNGIYQKQKADIKAFWQCLNNIVDHIVHQEQKLIMNRIISVNHRITALWDAYHIDDSFALFGLNAFNDTMILVLVLHFVMTSPVGNGIIIMAFIRQLNRVSSTTQNLCFAYKNIDDQRENYQQFQEVLEKVQTHPVAEQVRIKEYIEFTGLKFQHESTDRIGAELIQSRPLRFTLGESILIDGKSGAGKSTLYAIMSSIIPKRKYECRMSVDGVDIPDCFESVTDIRSIGLQDSTVPFDNSAYDIIVTSGTASDDAVWEILRMVKLDELFQTQFKGNLHVPIRCNLSGGQKSKLIIARLIYRAMNSQILILDEPDKGLPAADTIEIIRNIMTWFKPRGILFLTVHTRDAKEQLKYDQVIKIDSGLIM